MLNRVCSIAKTRAAPGWWAAVVLGLIASSGHAAEAPLSITDVNDNIDLYRGKVVTVRGFFYYGPPHSHMLWAEGPEAIQAGFARGEWIGGRVRQCLDVVNYEALYRRNLRNRWVTITGRVLAAAPENDVINLSGCAGWNSIVMQRVKADRLPPGGATK